MIFALVYFTLVVGFCLAQHADAKISQQGFAMGYAEGSELIVKIFGPQPSLLKLQIFNVAQFLLFSLPGTFMPYGAWQGWLLAIPLAASGRHLLAVRKWRRAFETNGASLNESRTAWQKFLGL